MRTLLFPRNLSVFADSIVGEGSHVLRLNDTICILRSPRRRMLIQD